MRIFPSLLLALVLVILFGCSSANHPIAPNGSSKLGDMAESQPIPVYVSDYDPDGNPSEGMGLAGMFELIIDHQNAELIPVRSAGLEDALEVVDITNFLSLAPCTDCAKIVSFALNDGGHAVVTIGIKHPFDMGDPFKPISGRNRGDLHVFNVEGIIVSNNPGETYPGLNQTVANFNLINADGYTGYLTNAINGFYPTAATIHPYILHFNDYSIGNFDAANPMGFESVTNPQPFGNLVMAMGSDYDFKDYIFDFKGEGSLDFMYVVGCTYAVSAASKMQRFNPEFRIPQHNKKAASEVRVSIIENNLAAGSTSSEAEIEISVLDINHGVEVGDSLNQMRADSSIGAITIDIPGLLISPLLANTNPVSGDGRDVMNPLKFAATLTNQAGASIGTYSGLVKVTDTYNPGLNQSPLLNQLDGIERVDPLSNPLSGLFAIPEFATYAIFEIEVGTSNITPIVELISECDQIYHGGWTLLIVGSGTYDPDGDNLVLYEFDFNYDGINFNVDDYNTTGEPVLTPPLQNNTGSIIKRNFALRVTDDGIPAASGIGTLEIDLHPVNSNGKNIPLREGEDVLPIDLGINETTGEILVGFNDRQVWKYSPDYSSGEVFYVIDDGCDIVSLDVASNGHSLTRSDTFYMFEGGRSFMVDPYGNFTWRGSQGITRTVGVTELDGNWNYGRPVQDMLMILTNWPVYGDVRWFQMSYSGYNGYSGNLTSNLSGIGEFSSEIAVGFDFRRSPDVNAGEYWILEGEPRYEMELFRMPFQYLGATIGLDGGQSDDLNGFNDPRDLVLASDDRVFVLDVLSSGVNCIKLYDRNGNGIAILGTCGEIGGDPLAIESDEGDDEIHVLHSNGVSIFYPSEIP